MTSQKDEINQLIDYVIDKQKRDKPLPWQFAIRCFRAGYLRAYRSRQVGKDLNASHVLILKNWDSIDSVIKHRVFGMKRSFDDRLKKSTVVGILDGNLFCSWFGHLVLNVLNILDGICIIPYDNTLCLAISICLKV